MTTLRVRKGSYTGSYGGHWDWVTKLSPETDETREVSSKRARRVMFQQANKLLKQDWPKWEVQEESPDRAMPFS